MKSFYKKCGYLLIGLAASICVLNASAQIIGSDYVDAGATEYYSYYLDIYMTSPNWTVSGGTITSQSHSGFNHSATVQWGDPGSGSLAINDGGSQHDYLSVTIACPTVSNPSTSFSYTQNCGNTVITRNSSPPSGITWYWQTYSSGTDTGSSGSTYTVYGGGTYYLRARHSTYTTCWSSGYTSTSSVTVNAVPSGVTSPTGASRCGTGTVTLSATNGANGNTVQWHDASSGGTLLYTGTNYVTASLSSTTTFYASTYNSTTSCEGSRTAITATINSLPSAPASASASPTDLYGSGSVTLSATGAGSGETYVWYNASTGGTAYGSTTQSISSTTTFYAGKKITATACESASRTSVAVTVYQAAVISPTGPLFVAYGNGVTLSSTNTYYQYQWLRNDTTISGATSQTYLARIPGSYKVKVKGSSSAPDHTSPTAVIVNGPLTQSYNMVSTAQVLIEGVAESASLFTLADADVAQAISYSDGFGRTIQSIGVGQSPSKGDIVAPAAYTRHGLIDSTFLPYTVSTNDGKFRPNAIRGSTSYTSYGTSEQYNFYQNTSKVETSTYPFARTIYRSDPGSRANEQGAPGISWQPGSNHTVRSVIELNNSSYPVRRWKKDGTTSDNYPNGSVVVSIATDENDNKVHTYTNSLGQTVLKQVQEGTNNWLQTYYIYDEYGRLKYQVPPKAVDILDSTPNLESDTNLPELIYKYTYDSRGRVIVKKVPGSAEQHIVYDKLDRVVLTQDGNLRGQNKWMFIKYDFYNRPVYSGLYASSSSRSTLQSTLDGLDYNSTAWYETEASGTYDYSNNAFPTSGTTVLAINYYDHYDFNRNGPVDYKYDSVHLTGQESTSVKKPRGSTTGSRRVTLDAAGNPTSTWLVNMVFYGKYDRTIQTLGNNHLYTTAADKSTVIYDFAGKTLKTKTTHNSSSSASVVLVNRNEYDFAGRLVRVYHSINGGQEIVNAYYKYNELGQVVEKNLHCTDCSDAALSQPGTINAATVERTTYSTSEKTLLATQSITLSPNFYATAGNNLSARIVSASATIPGNGGTYLQSVDYRYNIRGWLKSINNSQLTNDGTLNDDTGDFFGMELAYHTDAGMSNTAYYNGNVSAIKWKSFGTTGAADQRSYKYSYDKSDRLTTAAFQANTGSAWTKESGTLDETMTYDGNGNISTLARKYNNRGLSGTTVTSSAGTMDNLTYTYASYSPNRHIKIEDSGNTAGFNNGITANAEYKYDTIGNVTADKNKGIDSVHYNFLGKVRRVKFSSGKVITYTYDAAGTKLKMSVTASGSTTTTDYVGSFVYENSVLSFFSSPEGRVVKNASNYEYQYAIADHQGNTRVIFSSVTPDPVAVTATFEGDSGDNSSQFSNVNSGNVVSFTAANHTSGGSKVIRMNQNYSAGPSKSLKVYPGDKVDMEVYCYFESASGYGSGNSSTAAMVTAIAAAFGGASGAGGESGSIYDGVNSALGGFGLGSNPGDTRPSAFINYVLFDQAYKVMDMGWTVVPSSASFSKQLISIPQVTVKEAGYIFVYLSYEDQSNNYVYFDDFEVTHTKSSLIQGSEYYPFGLQTANSWTRENQTGNNFLGNGGTEMNTNTGWFDLAFRNYDPALGRMNGVDPMADSYSSHTPYNYSFNDPATYNDPTGADPDPDCYVCNVESYNTNPYYTYGAYAYLRTDIAIGPSVTAHANGNWGSINNEYDWSGFDNWVNNRVQMGIMWKGIKEAYGSKGNSFSVDPRTGVVTNHDSPLPEIRHEQIVGMYPGWRHADILETAFSGILTGGQIESLIKGSEYADSKRFQKAKFSYMHAMRAFGQGIDKAKKLMESYILRQGMRFEQAMNKGNWQKAYFELGQGMHPLMDMWSPSHAGWQVWAPEDWAMSLVHVIGEYATNTGVEAAKESVRSYYDYWKPHD